jgi:hypothetical protein
LAQLTAIVLLGCKNDADLAVEAVIGEPVSVSEFPVSRENAGKCAA